MTQDSVIFQEKNYTTLIIVVMFIVIFYLFI